MLIALLAVGIAAAQPAIGVAVGDPTGLHGRVHLRGMLLAQGTVGWRVLCDVDCDFPGPLATADLLVMVPPPWDRVGLHPSVDVGLGLGLGGVGRGCWQEAIDRFCVDAVSFSGLLRAPVGFNLRMDRAELGVEAVPAFRVLPDPHLTFMGGIALRYDLW